MDVPALGEENLAKDSEKNDKNWMILLCRVGEREKLKKLLKKCFEQVKHWIKKKKLIHDIRLIEKRFRSIEIDRDPLEFFIAISIDRKTDSIDRNCKKNEFLKINRIWCNLSSKHWKIMKKKKKNAWVWDEIIFTYPRFKTQFSQKFRFQTISSFFSSNKSVVHKIQSIFQTWLVRPKTHRITCTMFCKE